MKTELHLVLKRGPFEDIKSGKKTIEYRLLTPYWKKRIVDHKDTLETIRFVMGMPKKGTQDYNDKCMIIDWKGYEIRKTSDVSKELGAQGYDVYTDEQIEENPEVICIKL